MNSKEDRLNQMPTMVGREMLVKTLIPLQKIPIDRKSKIRENTPMMRWYLSDSGFPHSNAQFSRSGWQLFHVLLAIVLVMLPVPVCAAAIAADTR